MFWSPFNGADFNNSLNIKPLRVVKLLKSMKVLSVLKEEVRIMRIESHPNLASITLVALFLVFTPFYPTCADIISQLSMLCGGPSAVKLVTLLINVAFSVHMSACAFWRIKVSKTRENVLMILHNPTKKRNEKWKFEQHWRALPAHLFPNRLQKYGSQDRWEWYRSFRSDDRPVRSKRQILMLLQRIWKAWVSIRKWGTGRTFDYFLQKCLPRFSSGFWLSSSAFFAAGQCMLSSLPEHKRRLCKFYP